MMLPVWDYGPRGTTSPQPFSSLISLPLLPFSPLPYYILLFPLIQNLRPWLGETGAVNPPPRWIIYLWASVTQAADEDPG